MNLSALWRRLRGGRPAAALDPALGDTIAEFEARIGYTFTDRTLICGALTHRSYLNSNGCALPGSNERLEFLGDSVLELVVNHALYLRFPRFHEGELTKMKSLLVSRAVLAGQARRLDLGRYIFLSDAERVSGGAERASILADGFEAVIGALYLDGGIDPARSFIERHLLAHSEGILDDSHNLNYKSLLQERVQETLKTYPRYRTVSETGPDHQKVFTVEVLVRGQRLGLGKGTNKKRAEQAAAQNALEKLGVTAGEGEAAPTGNGT